MERGRDPAGGRRGRRSRGGGEGLTDDERATRRPPWRDPAGPSPPRSRSTAMIRALRAAAREHWPEASMEALGLGLFMVSAGMFGTLLEAAGSPLRTAIPEPAVRRALMGLAMGLTAVGLIY